MTETRTDVLIIGSGIIGSTSALILRRAGFTVRMIDRASHPRFALGESTIPPASVWMRLLADRWKVPELADLAHAGRLNEKIAASSGIKRNFGFVHHRPEHASHSRSWALTISDGSDRAADESHLFRQDVDAALFYAAIAAGVLAHVDTTITRVEIASEAVRVTTSKEAEYEARFIIDASGYRSLLSEHLQLRESPPGLRTNSRALFTHMVGVEPYDAFFEGQRPPSGWHAGTLHHIFPGGWMWVIPFDNHPDSRNPLCSVGLNLDREVFPETGIDGAAEWDRFMAMLPSIAPQFERARPVRNWISTGRLQYRNKPHSGARYWISPHATGAVDALYSRGLLHAFQGLFLAIPRIVEALESDVFSAERLAVVDRMVHRALLIHDRLVYGAYRSMDDPDLLQHWLELWCAFEGVTVANVRSAERAFEAGDLVGAAPATVVAHEAALVEPLEALADIMRAHGRETSATQTRQRLGAELARLPRFDEFFSLTNH